LGGLGAIVFGELAMEGPKNISLGVVMLGIGVCGLDMVAKRKAEISMRYTNRMHPTFYVFRGIPAIGWGITIFLFVVLIVGYSVIDMTEWTSAKVYFGDRPGIVITLVGVMITAWGVGNAGYATWRRGIQEGTVSRWQRLGDRITGVLVIPVGLGITAMGVLYLAAPATAAAIREAGRDWGIGLLYRLKEYLESSRM
jgi:hypothetical protein